MLKVNIKKDAPMVICSIRFQAIILRFFFASCTVLGLNIKSMHAERHDTIPNYFFAPDKVIGFFSTSLLEKEHTKQEICTVPLRDEVHFNSIENKAKQYREVFGFCGECTYAMEYPGGEVLAGFAHGALMKARNVRQRNFPYIMLVPKSESSLFGSSIKTCQYLESDEHNSLVIVGQQNNAISVWDLSRNEIRVIGSTKRAPVAIVNGPVTNSIIAQYQEGFSLLLLDYDCTECKIKDFDIGTPNKPVNILGVAPYKCGIAVKTNKKTFLVMPYPKDVYLKILQNDFNALQIKRLKFFINAAQEGKNSVTIDYFEKRVFDTLPYAIKALLTILGPQIQVKKNQNSSVFNSSRIIEEDNDEESESTDE